MRISNKQIDVLVPMIERELKAGRNKQERKELEVFLSELMRLIKYRKGKVRRPRVMDVEVPRDMSRDSPELASPATSNGQLANLAG